MAGRPITEAPETPLLVPIEDDIHAVFRATRERAPVSTNAMGMAVALRARHLETVLSDATRQLETESKMMQGIFDGPIFESFQNSILFSNGEAHRRRRQPLARTFAFKLMEGLRPKAAATAAELVQERMGAGPVDFLGEISAQIPARMIADVLGIPRSDLPYFQELVARAVETLGFFDMALRPELEANSLKFNAYVASLLEDRRRSPREDFLSEFAAATAETGELSEAEIVSDVASLIIAGSDTTKNTIAMTLSLLLRHPGEWAKLVADPEGAKKGAAAEGLRFEPVASGVPRIAVSEFELDGWIVPPGTFTLFSIVSATRDPDVYANPDVFDIARTDHPRWHYAFGGGAHRCLGEALARVEIEETLAAVARLAPKTRIEGAAPRMANAPIRAVDQMHVAFA
jgi:hypothetical protein